MESSSIDDIKDIKHVSFNIYQYDAQLALAFQADCEALLNKFSQFRSYSFEDFANLWKETCFMAIFDGQEYYLMLQAFVENCFFIVKKFLFSPDLYVQAGAIYVLYALYYKQPIKDWVKIRLTQVETDKMSLIVKDHKESQRYEVPFIHNKMRLDGAFHYCALVQPLGLDPKFSKRVNLGNEEIIRTTSLNHNPLEKFKKLIEQDPLLTDLIETDNEYQSRVKKYKETCKQLYVFPSNIGKGFHDTYNKILGNCSNKNDEEVEDHIKEIKNRAMSNKNATYRADKSVVTGVDLDTSPK